MKKGRRGKILLDTLDVYIIRELRKEPQPIMKLKHKMKLEHKNLTLHLDRLSKAKLIKKTPTPKSRRIMLSVPKKKRVNTILDIFS